MYLDYYKLEATPFQISPDPRFFWVGHERRKALAGFQSAILQSRGFVVLAGEPGTGKSTMLNAVISRLGGDIRFAKIIDPALDEKDFFNNTASALEMGRTFQDKEEFLFELESLLNQPDSKRIVFIIDEAQRLAPGLLELIDGFFKAATLGPNLGCTFAGQPVFLDMLNQNRALRRRIAYKHIIEPFTPSETDNYIAHRLKVAGRETPIFTAEGVQEIFNLSKGNPGLINVVCERALLAGYATHRPVIGPDLVRQSMEETSRITTSTATERSKYKADPVAEPLSVETAASMANGSMEERRSSGQARRTKVYAFTVAIFFIVAVVLFLMMNGGTRVAGIFSPEDNLRTAKKTLPAEPSIGAEELRRLREQNLELRRDRDQTLERLKAIQAKFDALESELRDLRAAKERTKGLERAITWKDEAISQLRRRLEQPGPNQTDNLRMEIETLKKVNSRLQERLDELNR